MNNRLKATALLLALVMAVFALTGCTKDGGEVVTLYDTNALKIEQEGAETRIYDLEGDAEYTFTSRKVRAARGTIAHISEAKTAADTDTVTVQTVYGVIIVTVKETGETLYIR